MNFEKKLEHIRHRCVYREDAYWSVKLEEDEVAVPMQLLEYCHSRRTLHILKDPYHIGIVVEPSFDAIFIYGSIHFPKNEIIDHDVYASWSKKYNDFKDMNVELLSAGPYVCYQLYVTGCADLLRPLEDKPVIGPVQMLERIRRFIQILRMEEKRVQTDRIREELMMEACHPRRVAAWCEAGFDPFV
jgi:hypothetical protein